MVEEHGGGRRQRAGASANGRWAWLLGWPDWAGYAASAWSSAYGALGLFWALGGAGFPFAKVPDDRATLSPLEGTSAATVAPAMAVLGAVGAVAGILMARGWGRRGVNVALLVFAWVTAATLALAVPDYTLLALLAFAPVLVVFVFTGVPGEQDGVGDILYWHRVNLIIMFLGGLLWAATALAYQRRVRHRCLHCGRGHGGKGRVSERESALRVGRWAVLVSVLAPIPYEVTRIAWYLGHPMGITDEFLKMMQDTPGMLEVGLGAAIASIGGGVLTHGLVHRWGEVYPRWIWFRAGRRVPPALAIVPASIVALVLIPAGGMNARIDIESELWAANGMSVLWIIWGLALGTATYAYHIRRRGRCRRCGRGGDTGTGDDQGGRRPSRGHLPGVPRPGGDADPVAGADLALDGRDVVLDRSG